MGDDCRTVLSADRAGERGRGCNPHLEKNVRVALLGAKSESRCLSHLFHFALISTCHALFRLQTSLQQLSPLFFKTFLTELHVRFHANPVAVPLIGTVAEG